MLTLSNLGPRMLNEDWSPGFYITFIKDMGIALEDASRMGLSLPGLELAIQFWPKLLKGKVWRTKETPSLASSLTINQSKTI